MANELEVKQVLTTITRLLAAQVGTNLKLAERAALLDRLGVDRGTIALVCNITEPAVRARVSEVRRADQAPRSAKRARTSEAGVWRRTPKKRC